ncbi:hypothetical protein BJ973_003865 [Actinoplanes tereljensis]|uniref:Knr4/Smi1-like domain-containing protein n=1 Tax=Paractinoplanes tereljensis TaxID=571912 RepID=A0A919NYC7_9ACTN|nr:SMI1/KNR4 family protein [Actinoplanes tereljensis]GIF25587.1 hypothetical protein Ate02nite_83170 [Actinoplanes tereljensis]
MDFADFREIVEETRAAHASKGYPPEIRLLDEVRADDDDIAAAEAELGLRFPEKYRQVMTTYGGGMFGFIDLLAVRDGLLRENTGAYAVAGFVSVAPVGSGDMWGFAVHDGRCEETVSMHLHDIGEVVFAATDFLEFVATRGLRRS